MPQYTQNRRRQWPRRLVLKGVLSAQDARRAVDAGVDAVIVSNHGGRQFDGALTAIEALPAVANTVNGRVPIIFDSGIRSGLDIMRALALGADFVLLGRAFLYGVAALGLNGAYHVVEILSDDLRNNMIQWGVEHLGELRGRAVV